MSPNRTAIAIRSWARDIFKLTIISLLAVVAFFVRVASRLGERVEFIEVAQVTHFHAKDKLTFAVSCGKEHNVDFSIAELEERLPPNEWVRIHRSTLMNIAAVKELHSWFGGKLLIKLKDGRTELKVARERAAEVRAKLGL